jgi:hypothetical protein
MEAQALYLSWDADAKVEDCDAMIENLILSGTNARIRL